MVERYNNGQVKACVRAVNHRVPPKSYTRQLPFGTVHVTWYGTPAEAEAALKKVEAQAKL
jgi:hypothetical protein